VHGSATVRERQVHSGRPGLPAAGGRP